MNLLTLCRSMALCLLVQATALAQADQKLTHDIFKELIEINTTHSVGSTTRAAEAMAARLKTAGFTDKDIFIGGPTETKGNLVATLRGSGKRKPLLLLAHLDVVEALREDWTTDPFKFEEIDGFYYARGASDDKAMAAIFVANLIRLKRERFIPDRDIIVALTADEEGGDNNGVKWLLENHKDLINAEYALNEGGRGQEKDGKKILNQVQLSEKVFQSFTLEVHNRGGHSSQPRKDNAIYKLAHALDNLSKFDFPLNLNEGTRVYFERSSKIETGTLAADMKGILQTPYDAGALARLSTYPNYNALLRTTCVATMIHGGHADNALPQTATANVNCRILPGEDPEKIKATLITVFNDPDVSVTAKNVANMSPPSPLNPELFGPIERITQKMWPGVPVVPVMSTGATDGAHLRNGGIPTYGVCGIFADMNDVRAHGKDERIGIKAFYEGQEFLYQVVRELSIKTSVKREN
ncbi:M20/M25/M40 family metallo-hydrolase [Chryseolinea lacunae]|uniref:M20/M25/M40 family metallo-hydrolase n=1 Tax=Chryseolinea lacunae TaxID=2801331 RepID=A0ABS1KXU6_9BACT|nr:M20/M25/M40 family metallo-hydrolase [Chryseolinea lacunae]MBL0744219.1 M20/M25/M40 family metallo-hydrolase [Chryseolinea lacunae]